MLQLFRTYSTQWRVGANGPVGLDFNVFHHALDRKGVTGEAFDEWIDKLTTIESAALAQLRRK